VSFQQLNQSLSSEFLGVFLWEGLGGEVGREMNFKMEFDVNVFSIDFFI